MKRGWLKGVLLWALLAGSLLAQQGPTPQPTATAGATPVVSPSPVVMPFPVADIATHLDSSQSTMDEVQTRLQGDTITVDVEGPLNDLSQVLERRSQELKTRLEQHPSLADLGEMERDFTDLGSALPAWKRQLNQRNRELEGDIEKVHSLELSWQATLDSEASASLPAELLDRIRATLQQLTIVGGRASRSQAKLLVLLTRLSLVDSKIQATKDSLVQTRKHRVEKFLDYDAGPIWNADFSNLRAGRFSRETLASLRTQVQALADYFKAERDRFVLHLLCVGVLFGLLRWARHRVKPWAEQEPTLKDPADVFNTPLATALLLSVILNGWFYPQPPPLLEALLAAATLLPAVAVLRRLLARDLHPTLYVLVLFFSIDQLRTITAPQPVLTRLIFSAEVAAVCLYLLLRIRSYRKVPHDSLVQRARVVALAIFSFSLGAAVLGFVGLAYTTGEAALRSTYLAVFLSSTVRIAEGIVMLTMRTPPLSLLESVRSHRQRYCDWLHRLIRYGVALIWVFESLGFLGVRQTVEEFLASALSESWHIGAVRITLGGALGLGLSLWLPFHLSRFVRFVLEQDVYPRIRVSRGATYTLSTVIHYLLLIGGGLFGLAALGIDMTQFTIVASALGVGIGFGLQSIVNNFVSGLILLFERPVEVGHVIEVGNLLGTLQRVGLRASVVRTVEGSDIIIPNGELLSTRVTNWTLADRWRLLRIPASAEYGSSADQVMEILLRVGRSHPRVQLKPEPEVLFLRMGDSSLDFELRVWTADFERWLTTQSDLVKGIYQALNEAGIVIPFPQRTLHLETWPAGAPPASPETPP